MRIDVKNLLNRLGKQDFAYKEFEDRFSELELWPLLEALLRDPRMQAFDQAQSFVSAPLAVPSEAALKAPPSAISAQNTFTHSSPQTIANREESMSRVVPSARVVGGSAMFDRYANTGDPLSNEGAQGIDQNGVNQSRDMRSMLRNLSEGSADAGNVAHRQEGN